MSRFEDGDWLSDLELKQIKIGKAFIGGGMDSTNPVLNTLDGEMRMELLAKIFTKYTSMQIEDMLNNYESL